MLHQNTKNEASTENNKTILCDLKHALYDERAASFNSSVPAFNP